MTPPRLLLALDLDGTLLRDDKTIAHADAEAIRNAAAHGIAVTLATGRLINNTLPIAQQLGLTTPLVCADGGLMVDALSGALLHTRQIALEPAARALEAMLAHELTPYVFLPEAIHCEPAGECHRALVSTWSPAIFIHPTLASTSAWQSPEGVSMTVGIGSRENVEHAYETFCNNHGGELDTVYFGLFSETIWALRSLAKGCDKGEMLARLAANLNLPRERVAVVGDWFNDLGMFKYAGHSFAMGHAPEYVRQAATHTLRATSRSGGGIAEAIEALLKLDLR